MLMRANTILIRQRIIATFFMVYKVSNFGYDKEGEVPPLSLILHQRNECDNCCDELDYCGCKIDFCFGSNLATAFLFLTHFFTSFPWFYYII